jgi:hypothetical protein
MFGRWGLLVLGMLPIVSVAFAAKSSLKVNQIRNGVAGDDGIGNGGSDSHSS